MYITPHCLIFPILLAVLTAYPNAVSAQKPAIESFRPLISTTESEARCEVRSSALLEPGESGLSLRFSGTVDSIRVVSAVWDSLGALVRYSDARGDLRGPPVARNELGARTSILIDGRKGLAILLNERGSSTLGSLMTGAQEALDAEHLGPPRALLARLQSECGVAKPPG